MPFKTRRHKLAAAQRRYTFVQSKPINYSGNNPPSLSGSIDVDKPKVEHKHIDADYGYVRNDLIKILLFAGAICLVQVTLMFILRTHNFVFP